MIIVIDDDFDRRFGEIPGVMHATTPEDGLALVRSHWGEITHLFLDHDLGYDDNLLPLDIRPVVSWLEERAVTEGPGKFTIWVHSMNPKATVLSTGLNNRGYTCHRVALTFAQKLYHKLVE